MTAETPAWKAALEALYHANSKMSVETHAIKTVFEEHSSKTGTDLPRSVLTGVQPVLVYLTRAAPCRLKPRKPGLRTWGQDRSQRHRGPPPDCSRTGDPRESSVVSSRNKSGNIWAFSLKARWFIFSSSDLLAFAGKEFSFETWELNIPRSEEMHSQF